ncbi:hypothetical protein GTP23_06720 [Pseudoduganella sp. FT93W]|uniref:DUF4386 family protein n=1 Tax=Duganella fentianensis TaxID=2692177 RepID=A0A845HYZ2_9BURK|nr:hypothetical protein [Duganella fentianensis]MYN44765.1 hypothetical protein [Duganella fentianensis]
MLQKIASSDSQRFAGRVAVVGAILAWTMAILLMAAAGFDFDAAENPVSMLAFSAEAQNLYRLGMWADILGWYIPFLVVGGFLWQRMRQRMGVDADIALVSLVAYALLGMVGAGMLNLTLPGLATLYTGHDAAGVAAAQATWTALQNAAQGIWNIEAPVLMIWGATAAKYLKAERWGYGGLLKFDVALFGIEFLLNLLGRRDFAMSVQMLTLLIHPLWLLLFGLNLLRLQPVSTSLKDAPRGQAI